MGMKISTAIKNSFTLGQVIQQSRMQQGISQRELAKALGISQKWVWEMEQGKPGVLMDRLFKILEKTGITLSAEFEVKDRQENEQA
jgi:transcriptional regulator with XRE-family HTH domain